MDKKQQILILVVILFAYCIQEHAIAWTESAWPAKTTSPRKDCGEELARDVWVQNCYSALCERADLVWDKYNRMGHGWDMVAHPDAPRFYRIQSTYYELVNMKNWITNHSKYFVDWTEMGTNADFNVWMRDNAQILWDPTTYTYYTNFPMEFPTFSNISHLASASGVPANFFTVSFWRDINGYAGLSDDSIVAGYGREDYGFDGLRRVITNLSMVQVGAKELPETYMSGYGKFEAEVWYTNHSEAPTCAEIIAYAKSEALVNVETQVFVTSGFLSLIDPVYEDALWLAGTVSYETFHNFGRQSPAPQPNMKFNLYVTKGYRHNVYGHDAAPKLAESLYCVVGETNAFSIYVYGATGFIGWPQADCTNYNITEYEGTYSFGPPIAYVEFSGLKYQ